MKEKPFGKMYWGLILIDSKPDKKGIRRIHHFCGYKRKPKNIEKTILQLQNEIENDKEFKFSKKLLKNTKIEEASKDVLRYFNNIFERVVK